MVHSKQIIGDAVEYEDSGAGGVAVAMAPARSDR
jgi:hypothetical protein